MKKAAHLFFSIFLAIITLLSSSFSVFAAGETFSWVGNNIQVSGGSLMQNITLTSAVGAGYYRGTLVLKSSINTKGCGVNIMIQVSDDQKTGRITQALGQDAMGGYSKCPANIVSPYLNQTVNIGGTPPNGGKETAAGKKVHVQISVPDAKKGPDSLVITIGKDKVTAKKTVDADGNGFYIADFQVEAGDHKVCAPPVLKCQSFTKQKNIPKNLIYGDIVQAQTFDVEINVSFTAQSGQTCQLKGYVVELKKDGKTVKSIKTNDGPISEPRAGEENSLGGLKDSTVTLRGKFEKIAVGKYQVCIPETGECKDVSRTDKTNFSPNPVKFDIKKDSSTNICVGVGERIEPTLPPPPPPPCGVALSADGKCASFKTAFGLINTNPGDFVVSLFNILLSISGAIALALIIRAGYTIMTSQGKPDQLQAGREQLIAAVVGLLFLIFSFVILQTIGVDILKVPTDKGSVGDTGGGGAASK